MFSRETRTRIEAWSLGAMIFGFVPTVGLSLLGAPAWLTIVPMVPGLLFALWAFSCLTLVADRGPFLGFVAIASIFAAALWGVEAALTCAIGLLAARIIAEAMSWAVQRMGWHDPLT